MTKRDEYTCAVCGGTFTKGWSEGEARAELDNKFGVPVEECDLVCDGCYKRMGFGDHGEQSPASNPEQEARD